VALLEDSLDTLQVFLLDLDLLRNNPAYDPEKVLSATELEQAGRFATPQLRNRFVSRRWILRTILSDYCNEGPEGLSFETGEYGKPFLSQHPIQFSFSHTRNNAAIAIADSGQVGIDIETIPSMETCNEVASRLLTGKEDIQHLISNEEEYRLAFLHYWTLKEAMIKAIGEGLSRDLKDIEFQSINPRPLLSRIPDSYGNIANWNLHKIYLEKQQCMVAAAYRN
jgi:4'-phosphopantetheinyl transferase